jgi:alanine racemase
MIYLEHLLEATGGRLHHPASPKSFQGFSHDTRQIAPDELFVAIRGARGDGHDYLLDAVRLGASGLLVEAQHYNTLPESVHSQLAEAEIAIVLVRDTRLALQAYASFILSLWQPIVIAVTGSVGKTSCKEAIANVLATHFPTFRSWQNYNDLLGIPLSLGRLEQQHVYAVLELGVDRPGEIAELCQIVQPRLGILTGISPVQLQYFSNPERLAEEMGSLLTSLPSTGLFFYHHHDHASLQLVTRYQQRQDKSTQCVIVPIQPATAIEVGWQGVTATVADEHRNTISLHSHLLGAQHSNTMLTAYHIARSQGMEPEETVQAIAQLKPLIGRLNPLKGVYGSRLLDDTHNAAPASMQAALQALHALTPSEGKRIAILGDMLNLGTYSELAHQQLGRQVARSANDLIVHGEYAAIVAEAAHQAGLGAAHINITSTHEDAARIARSLLDEKASADVVLIKGSEETRMERVSELLMARPWKAPEKLVRQTPGWKKTIFRHADRPTWVEIDLNAIGNNTRQIKTLVGPKVQVLISLKADAYGHGAVRVARTALHNGANMLGVATVSEAIPLREASIHAPILVFGYVPRWQMREAVRLGVTVTLYSSELAQELSRTAVELGQTVKAHVKIDTGMARLGIRAEQIDEIIELIREINHLPGLEMEGIYTHFATADDGDQSYARLQLARFEQILRTLEAQRLRPPIVHAANSAATLSLPESHYDLVRPGIAIYGLDPSPEVRLPESMRAALSFKTQVSQVKLIPAGEGISYGKTYVTSEPTRVAVLPVGYADGFRRTPQNWGSVLIHGQEAPLLGRVCMDQCMVDVSHIPQARIGDEVVLIGHQGQATLTVEMVAQRLGTINYEVVAELLARVPRVD